MAAWNVGASPQFELYLYSELFRCYFVCCLAAYYWVPVPFMIYLGLLWSLIIVETRPVTPKWCLAYFFVLFNSPLYDSGLWWLFMMTFVSVCAHCSTHQQFAEKKHADNCRKVSQVRSVFPGVPWQESWLFHHSDRHGIPVNSLHLQASFKVLGIFLT